MKKKEEKKPDKEAGKGTPKESGEESPSKNESNSGSKDKSGSGQEGKTPSDESDSKKEGTKSGDKSVDKSGEKTGTKSGEDSNEKSEDKSGGKSGEKSGDKSGGQSRKGSGDKPPEQPRKGSGDKPGEKSGGQSRKGSGEKSGESGEQASKESGTKSGEQSRKGSGGEKSGERSGERTSKGSGEEKSGEKTGEEPSKESGEKSGAKSGEQSKEASGDKTGTSAEPASKESPVKSGTKSGEQSRKGSGEQPSKGSGEKSSEQSRKGSGAKSSDQSRKGSEDKSGEKSGEKSGTKSGEKSGEKSPTKSGGKSGEGSGEASTQKSGIASGAAGSRRKSPDKSSKEGSSAQKSEEGSKESSGKKESGESGVSEKITPQVVAVELSAGASPVEFRSPLKEEDLDRLLIGKEEAALLPEVATPPTAKPAPPPPPSAPAKRSFFSFFRKHPPPQPPPGDVEAAAQPGVSAGVPPPAPPPAKGGFRFPFSGKKPAPPPVAAAPPGLQGPDVGSGGDLGPSGAKSVEEQPIVATQVQPREALPPRPSFMQRMKGMFSKKPPPPGLQQPPIGGPPPGPQPLGGPSPGVQPPGAQPMGIQAAGAPPRGPAPPGFAQRTGATGAPGPARDAGVPPLDIPESLGDTGSLEISQSVQKGAAPPPGLKAQGQPPPGFIGKGPAAPGFQKGSQISQKVSGSEAEGSQSIAEEGSLSGGAPAAGAPAGAGFKAAAPGAPLRPGEAGESGAASALTPMKFSDYGHGQQEPAPPLVLPYQAYAPDIRQQQLQKLQKKIKLLLLVVVLLVSVILLVVLLCALNVFGCYNMPSFPSIYTLNETTVCLSDGCKGFVSRFATTMLSSVDPCEDFYEHVCGGWLHETVVPFDSAAIDVVTEAQRAIDEEMMDMMNHTVVSYKDQSAMQKAAAAYQGCINMEFRNNKGTKPLENLLDHFGITRWPIVQSNFQVDVVKVLADMIREVGLDALIRVRVFPDFHDNQKHAIYIGQPTFGVERQVLRARFRSPYFRILHRYKLYIYRCSLIMGATVAAADLVNEIVGFESKIAAIAEETTPLPNPRKVYNTLTVKALETAAPLVQWTLFLNNILKDVQVTLDLNDRVIVMNHVYLKRLSELIKDTPEYIVANYLGWRLVQRMGHFTIERMRRATFRFNRYRYSTMEIAPLSRDCFGYISHYMRFAVGRFFYDRDRQKPIERKEKVQEMADEVKDAFGIWLDLAPWINEANKKTGMFKLREMKVNAGYPLWIKSDGELNDYYARIPDLRKEDFFGAMLKIMQEYQQNEFSRLKQYGYANDYGWIETQEQFDPSYQYLGNYLLLAEAYIQEPFFRMTASPSVNYGGLGSVLGRYITSGFTAHGSLFNALGNLDDWWNPASRRGYVREARCFASQIQWYTNPFTGEEINGTAHMDGLVVDNAAVKEAYKAYRVYMTKYEELYKLIVIPGLETYTQDQLFFVSYAMTMCEKIRRRSLYTLLNPTPKISNHYRTNLPLMNFERFAIAFNCPLGSPMNPEFKCDVY